MNKAKNLIRERLKLAISSYWSHKSEDFGTQIRIASLWHEDCYGYITAMLDLNLITWHEYVFYTNINDKIKKLSLA